MRRFEGYRSHPPEDYVTKGITNAGADKDYEGVIYSDGTVAIRWMTKYQSHSVWPDWDTFYYVHGHPEYGTAIRFLDGE